MCYNRGQNEKESNYRIRCLVVVLSCNFALCDVFCQAFNLHSFMYRSETELSNKVYYENRNPFRVLTKNETMPPIPVLKDRCDRCIEAFRRFKNIFFAQFSGEYLGALTSFCHQRQLLMEELRRAHALAATFENPTESSHKKLFVASPGPSGVLALFRTTLKAGGETGEDVRSCFPLLETMIAQHDNDISAILAQMHKANEQCLQVHGRLKELAVGFDTLASDGDDEMPYDCIALERACCSMAAVTGSVFVWVSRALVQLREAAVDPLDVKLAVSVPGLEWWSDSEQDIDADRVWRLACNANLDGVAQILLAV